MAKLPLSFLTTFKLWFPITLMWLLTAGEQPLVQSIAARLPNPTMNLAVYGYSFFSMLIFESPIFMLISASNALVKGERSLLSFRRYAYPICISLTVLLVLSEASGLFFYISHHFFGLDQAFSELSSRCFLFLAPAPMMVGYRRFHQGVLVKGKAGKWLAIGGILRIFADIVGALALILYTDLQGAEIVCLSMGFGIMTEAYFVSWRTTKLDFKSFHENEKDSDLSIKEMNHFYVPLALSSIVMIGSLPLCNLFIAQSPFVELSLASWPVVTSFIWLLTGGTLAIQEVIIAYRNEHPNNDSILTQFAVGVAILLSSIWMIVVLTPVYSIWFGSVIGLSRELTDFMFFGIGIASCYPALSLWQAYLKAQHTLAHTTRHISTASFLEFFAIGIIVSLLTLTKLWSGLLYAILGLMIARVIACLHLWYCAAHLSRAPNPSQAMS